MYCSSLFRWFFRSNFTRRVYTQILIQCNLTYFFLPSVINGLHCRWDGKSGISSVHPGHCSYLLINFNMFDFFSFKFQSRSEGQVSLADLQECVITLVKIGIFSNLSSIWYLLCSIRGSTVTFLDVCWSLFGEVWWFLCLTILNDKFMFMDC